MRLILNLSFLLLVTSRLSLAQRIEAVNEDSSRHVRFEVQQGVECQVLVGDRELSVRGKLALIDSTSFRLQLGDGSYTTVRLSELVRMRHRHYHRQHLAASGAASSLLSRSRVSSPSLGAAPLVAASALAGLGIALAGEKATFRRKDPSTYQGWFFHAFPQR